MGNSSDLPLPPKPYRNSNRRGGRSAISDRKCAMTSNRSQNNASERSCAIGDCAPPVSSKLDTSPPVAVAPHWLASGFFHALEV
jgi:hypothetical protein